MIGVDLYFCLALFDDSCSVNEIKCELNNILIGPLSLVFQPYYFAPPTQTETGQHDYSLSESCLQRQLRTTKAHLASTLPNPQQH